MNFSLLIDSTVRQTSLRITQLAKTADVRLPMAHITNPSFLNRVTELKTQGVGHKGIAHLFDLALRTNPNKISGRCTGQKLLMDKLDDGKGNTK